MRLIGLAVVPALLDAVEAGNLASGIMRRRELIAIAGTGLVAWPLVARAQQQARSARLGYLGFGSPKEATSATRIEALRAGLRDFGYVEGKNLVIEFRWSDTVEQLHEAAAELVRMKVDIIFSPSSTETEQARRATNTIPIVFATHFDPVSVGHVASLARPGGNITGVVGALVPSNHPLRDRIIGQVEPVAASLGVKLQLLEVATGDPPEKIDQAFAAMVRERAEAVLGLQGPHFFKERKRIAELSLAHRLPGIFELADYAEAGCLMAYAPNMPDIYRYAAMYVDRILKGARPADLPVEQPRKLDFVINLKTAKALRLTIPPSVLLRADQVIE